MEDLNYSVFKEKSAYFKYWGKARSPLEIAFHKCTIEGNSLEFIVEKFSSIRSTEQLKTIAQEKGWKQLKSDEGFQRYHLLPYHNLDATAVALTYLELNPAITKDLVEFLNLSQEQLRAMVGLFVAVHDLGKFASAFQNLVEFDDAPLFVAETQEPYNAKEARHDRLGYYFWKTSLKELKGEIPEQLSKVLNNNTTQVMLDLAFGHHGNPVSSSKKNNGIFDHRFTVDENLTHCKAYIKDCITLFADEFPIAKFADKSWRDFLRYASWHLSGICTLADWLGSDATYFKFCEQPMPLSEYWQRTCSTAKKILLDKQLTGDIDIAPYQSVKAHFGFDMPSPLQAFAETVEISNQAQLFILEDVTGAGKTEAALILLHRLLKQGTADGFYFGLPTMATSNAMYERVAQHYQEIMSLAGQKVNLVLAHGASNMHDSFQDSLVFDTLPPLNYTHADNTASQACHSWFADSKKKALLAQAGVGTIDQPLMAVLAAKHHTMRLHGLYRKVLILDEVHAADEYMLTLLEDLLRIHLRFGGSAILLTATLPCEKRERLCRIWQEERSVPVTPLQLSHAFPLATWVDGNGQAHERAIESLAKNHKSVAVQFVDSEQACIDELCRRAHQGQAVVWVRNTVKDAQRAYELLKKIYSPEQIILFHSRFTLHDRKQKEQQVLNAYGKRSSAPQRRGMILVATQVFQESLDADCDFMLSDICPIDDLIQRAGRLHRHIRDALGEWCAHLAQDQRPTPLLMVHAPAWQPEPAADWLHAQHQGTAAVYRSPAIIWLTQKVLREQGGLFIPKDARKLIESVYSQAALKSRPANFDDYHSEYLSAQSVQANKAYTQTLAWDKGYNIKSGQAWLDSDLEISTRYSDRVSIQVVVLTLIEGEIQLYATKKVEKHVLAHSEVRVDKCNIGDKLTPVPIQYQAQVEQLIERYPSLKYKQLWFNDADDNFSYSPEIGLIERESP